MFLAITTIFAVVLLTVVLAKRKRDRREIERYSITPEALHALMASKQEVLVVDVRQPLDLLGDSVIIPGAQWLAPEEVCANPSLLPKERHLGVYCTCPSDKTSRTILHRAFAMGFSRIRGSGKALVLAAARSNESLYLFHAHQRTVPTIAATSAISAIPNR